MSIFSNINVGLGKTINTVGDLNALKAYRPKSLLDGDTVIVTGQNGIDGNGGVYGWEETSTATADDFAVVRPNFAVGKGRWLRLFGTGATGPTGPASTVPGPQGAQGAPGGNIMAIATFTASTGLTIPAGTNVVRTSGYSTVGNGIADYQYDASVNTAYVAANPRSSFMAASGRGFKLITRDGVSVAQFGALGDGTDQTEAIQAAVNASQTVRFPVGDYKLTSPIQVRKGQMIYGAGTNIDYDTADRTMIHHDGVGGGCFWYTKDLTTVDIKGPEFYNLYMVADYPIRLNDENTSIVGDASGNCPPLARWVISGCAMNARVQSVGRGVALTKCFDGVLENSRIVGFGTNILINCCDLNIIRDNRIYVGGDYMILEIGSTSFTSQNQIIHNDILYLQNPTGTYIKSTARHSRIMDNYFEAGNACSSFIDLSNVAIPSFAGQVPGIQITAIVRDNRIDGHQYATKGVYILQAAQQDRGYAEIVDVGTTGATNIAPDLLILDAAGNSVDELPIMFNPSNGCSFSFKGSRFGGWDGYATRGGPFTMDINSSNIYQYGQQFTVNGAFNFIRARNYAIIYKNGGPTTQMLTTGFLEPSTIYNYVVKARVRAGSETLNLGYVAGSGGSSLNGYALTTKWQEFTVGFRTNADAGLPNGIYMTRSNNGNDIEIESIKISKGADFALDYTVGDTYAYTPGRTAGTISLQATEGTFAVFVNAEFKFINDKIALVGKNTDNASVIDVNATQSGGVVTFTLTGSSTGKRLTFSHKY